MSSQTKNAAAELAKYLDAFWGEAYGGCNSFYDDYDRGYEELENEPFECEVSRARIRVDGEGKISIDYSAVRVYNSCVAYHCGPYDEEEVDVDRAYARCRESCLEDAESYAMRVVNEYRKVVEKWAKKRGVAYKEELLRDELNFTLTIRLHPARL